MTQKQNDGKSTTLRITNEDRKKLLELYDHNKDGKLSSDELKMVVNQYNLGTLKDKQILDIVSKYDVNNDKHIDPDEFLEFEHEIQLQETAARYAGYAARIRYLAFTSDFGEALRPIVHKRIVNATYAIAFGYCFADVGYEAYKLHKRNYVTEKNVPMSLSQCIVERAAFQTLASVVIPFAVIHTTVDIAKKAFKKIGRFQRFGPSIVGLAVIPLLPMYLDHPVERAIEWSFEKFGPWAHKKSHKD